MGEQIAVTIIGGYLGSGKTTLVNRVLAGADSRVAVMVNDFGEVNIDESLIASVDGDTITLANGCICCSLVDGLAAGLADLLEIEPRPDRLVIETSGVADPADVAAYCHRPGYRLDLVLVMVDGEQIVRQANDDYVGETVRRQLAAADLLVLNKVDLIEPNAVADRHQFLAGYSNAPVVAATDGAVDLTVVFDRHHEPQRAVPGVDAAAAPDHHHVFASWSFRSDDSLDRERFETAMDALPAGVVRAKGVVRFDGDDRRWVFQRVGARQSLTADDGVASATELVAIGVPDALSADWLAEQLTN